MTPWNALSKIIVLAGKASVVMNSHDDSHAIIRALDPIWEEIKQIVRDNLDENLH